MKKGKLYTLGFLGSILPLTFAGIANVNRSEFVQVKADSSTSLQYVETTEGTLVKREYVDFYPITIIESFKAPYGCYLSLDMSSESIDTINSEIQGLPGINGVSSFSMVSIVCNREIKGSTMYAYSDTAWGVDVSNFGEYLAGILPTFNIYELEEKIADVTLSASVDVELYYENAGVDYIYSINFSVKPYNVKQYKDGDFLSLDAFYYRMGGDDRVTIRANILEDFFNNKTGFKTDGRTAVEWDENEFREKYVVSYIDKDTNLILDIDDAYDTTPGIEIYNMPQKPLNVFAKLTFTSGGKEYTFYSNELVLCEKIEGLLVDGYNNRNSVGKGSTHTLTITTDFDYDEILDASIDLTLKETTYNFESHATLHEGSNIPNDSEDGIKNFDKVTSEFFDFDFAYDVPGTYDIYATIFIRTEKVSYMDSISKFSITVVDEAPTYTNLDSALTLSKNGIIDCVAGADSFDILASFAEDLLNDGETPTYEWNLSRLNVVELVIEDNKAKIVPIGNGVVTIDVTCKGQVFGEVTKSVTVNVISDIYSICTVETPNEFHYSGKDLTVKLSVDKYANIINFNPEWEVINSEGEEVEFIDNGDMSITIKSPAQNNYLIRALYKGVEISSQTVEVRSINFDKFVQDNIFWILLITLGLLGIVIFIKYTLKKQGSLVGMIEKTYKKIVAIDRNDPEMIKKFNSIKISILAELDFAKNLNMSGFNEYEKTIKYLGKSLSSIKEITKTKEAKDSEAMNALFKNLDSDMSRALIVAKEIEEAKIIAYKNSLEANNNNIVKEEKKKKKSKEK